MRDSKKFIEYLFVIFLFCFGLCYYSFHILGFDLSQTPGDYGDSRFINYILEHGFKWLKGEDPDFWQANFMYPLKNNVAISDSMAGALPLYALFRFAGINVETSYQLWWLSSCILNFWCCFLAFKKIGFNVFLCAIGAYVFAYGINNFNQFYHLQFNYKFCIPIAIASLYLFLKQPLTKYFTVFILSITLQFYASAYLGILLIYCSIAFAVIYLLFRPQRKLFFNLLTKKVILESTIVSVIGFLLILLIAIPYFEMAKITGYKDYQIHILPHLPSIYSYFFPSRNSITWEFLKNSPLKQTNPEWYLQDLFPGIVCYLGLLCCIIYTIKQYLQKRAIDPLPLILFSVCVLFILLISKTTSNFSLFKYFRHLPGLANMRLASRFMLIILFFMIWLSIYFLNRLAFKKSTLLYVVIAFAAITDNLFISDSSLLSMTPKKIRETRVENMCALIKKNNTEHKKIIACINPSDGADAFMQNDVMLATQKLNLYTLNGYSSMCIGELCWAYGDTAHVKLSAWLKKYNVPENDVLFIITKGE